MKLNPTLVGFIKKEFRQTLRDPRMRAMLFVAPVIQMTLFGVAISSDIKNVRLAVQMAPNDQAMAQIYEHAMGSRWFIPAKTQQVDAFQIMQRDEADAVLIAPRGGLSEAIQRGRGEVQLLVNASNVIRAQSVENYIKQIVGTVIPAYLHQEVKPSPIQFDVRILYNPTMRTPVFTVPGVMSLLICLITVLLTSMSISREKEVGTFEMLISAPVTPVEIILGKTLPYVLLGISNIPLILGVAVFVFGVPMQGSLLVLGLSAIVFVCTTVAIGTFISTVTKTQQQSMMGSFLFMFPAIQLSGLMFPLENMPPAMKVLAYLNPITYFLELLRNIMLKGGSWQVITSHVAALLAMAVTIIYISFRRFRTTLG
jgi:ABC-2 type transport system permease protein